MYLWGEGAVVGTRMLGAQLHIVWGKPVRVEGATEGSELRAATGLEVRFDREQGLEPVLYRAWRDVTCQIRDIDHPCPLCGNQEPSRAIKNHREQSRTIESNQAPLPRGGRSSSNVSSSEAIKQPLPRGILAVSTPMCAS